MGQAINQPTMANWETVHTSNSNNAFFKQIRYRGRAKISIQLEANEGILKHRRRKGNHGPCDFLENRQMKGERERIEGETWTMARHP
jgi:hypothetical protein